MSRLVKAVHAFHNDERGHAEVGVPPLIAGVAAIALGIGVAADSDVTAIIAGIVLGVALFGAGLARHRFIDYDVYSRLDKLEK